MTEYNLANGSFEKIVPKDCLLVVTYFVFTHVFFDSGLSLVFSKMSTDYKL